jgi:hypothetical protein
MALLVVAFDQPLSAQAQGGFPGGSGQDEGTPILVVTDYGTSPSPIQSGESFTLHATVTNTGTKHADDVRASVAAGSQFVQLGAAAMVGKLEPGQSASFSLLVQTPKLSAGAYDLALQFAYRIGNSGEQTTPRSVGVTVGGSSASATGQPQVVIESAALLTAPGTVGEPFDVAIVLRNVGGRTAYNLSATLKLNDYLSPAEGSGSSQLGHLNAGQAVTLTLSMVLNKAAPSGRVAQTLSLSYRDSANTSYTADETASLDLGAAGRQSPQLIIAAHAATPERPAPGDTFTLTLSVTNVGAGPAKNVLLRLGDEQNGLKPFLALNTSNVAYQSEIAAGATVTFTYTLLMDGAATGGAYSLKAALSYENALGEANSESELIGLLALTRPQLQINLTKPLSDSVMVGQNFDIPVEVINIGRQRVDVSTVEIVSDDLALTKNSLYVGPLDSSISGGLTAKAVAQAEGAAVFRIVVHYRDELNRMQTLEQEMTVNVEATSSLSPSQPTTTAPPESGGPWQAILRFFGLGG